MQVFIKLASMIRRPLKCCSKEYAVRQEPMKAYGENAFELSSQHGT